MSQYRIVIEELTAQPSGIPVSNTLVLMKINGTDELISRIHSAIADEILNWQNSQKNTNKS